MYTDVLEFRNWSSRRSNCIHSVRISVVYAPRDANINDKIWRNIIAHVRVSCVGRGERRGRRPLYRPDVTRETTRGNEECPWCIYYAYTRDRARDGPRGYVWSRLRESQRRRVRVHKHGFSAKTAFVRGLHSFAFRAPVAPSDHVIFHTYTNCTHVCVAKVSRDWSSRNIVRDEIPSSLCVITTQRGRLLSIIKRDKC